ncbi:MAG: response regulator [Taibaiella sp.]|nr:response regulator [Taibaiella sp.]
MKNIYLVDDDKLFIFLLKKTIGLTGIPTQITDFPDGQSALDYIKANASDASKLPDVIFLDLRMPIMDGWEFLEEYKHIADSLAKKNRLYVFSSSISPYDIENAKNNPLVTDFIIKPILKEKFAEILSD